MPEIHTKRHKAARNSDALRRYDRATVSDDCVLIGDMMVAMRDDVQATGS